MIRSLLLPALFAGLCGAGLAGCGGPADPLLKPDALGTPSLADDLVVRPAGDPPPARPGQCWDEAETPAVFETETEHRLIAPARAASPGHPATGAEYQTVTHQSVVQDRRHVWFRAPCPEVVTPEFIGTLQRALLARGYYAGPLTGKLDPPTRAALRHYQAPLGLDSDRLSLGAAEDLGLVNYTLPKADSSDGG